MASQRIGIKGRLALVVPLAVLLLGLGLWAAQGRDDDPAPAAAPPAQDVTILQPGLPGEPATTVGPDAVPSAATWNHADVAFVQMMIPHHEQALTMARLAETRAGSPQVSALARRISGAQGPEIITLSAWLQARNIEVPRAGSDQDDYDHATHGHQGMAGMLTDEQLAELEAASGAEFDRLFVEGMIGHHEGAVRMADDVGQDGADTQVLEMAADVSAGQTAEIGRMRDLLRSL